MQGRIRRVITGHDKSGRAIVLSDAPAPAVRTNPLRPGHRSIDYAVVVEGEVSMLLDDEDVHLSAGDVVIQCGTNHAWNNRSDKPCRMLHVLIDGKFDPALKAQFGDDGAH